MEKQLSPSSKAFLSLSVIMSSAVAVIGAQPEQSQLRPNVVFILADDLGYGDLGCYGQQHFETPNIDRLASKGIRFTSFYAGTTVSAPSRCSLMTGLHTGHCYIRGNKEISPEGQEPIPDSTFTIAKLFKQAGYVTGAVGKWGLGGPGTEGAPEKQGFDEFFGFNCQAKAHNYYPDYLWHNGQKVFLTGNANGGTKQYAHDECQKMALDFIEKNQKHPFFLYCAYTLPHAELLAPNDELFQAYESKFEEKPFNGVDSGPRFRKGAYGSQTKPKAAFAAMVARLDRSVGEVVKKLHDLGIEKNTLIVFTSDNGPHLEGGADPVYFGGAGPLKGFKRSLYEGGIRVPFIACWPGVIQEGQQTEAPFAFWDFMPTVAELVHVQLKHPTDGISLLPQLRGEVKGNHDRYFYWEFNEGGTKQAVRYGQWKGVRFGTEGSLELYDLSVDIHEDNNVAKSHPELVTMMERYLNSVRTPSILWPSVAKWPENRPRD